MKIKVDELKLKHSYRAMMLWEMIMKKPFQLDGTMMSMVVLLWCIIEANNPGIIGLDEFTKWIDEEPEEFDKLCKWLTHEQQKQAELMPEEKKKKKGSKKKVTKKAT